MENGVVFVVDGDGEGDGDENHVVIVVDNDENNNAVDLIMEVAKRGDGAMQWWCLNSQLLITLTFN